MHDFADLAGKVCIVTGANSGIGRATATGLAGMGATVVIICRNRERGEAAAREIKARTGNSSVFPLLADLLSQSQIRRVVQEFSSTFEKLHVLINNAGSYFPARVLSEDGLESTFALNYLAPFLLTNLLLEKLKENPPSRVVNVSSVAHRSGKIDFDNLNGELGYSGVGAYATSKLALVIFTYELARRLSGSGVTANCLHPGAVRTNIWHHTGIFSPLTVFASSFMIGPEKGAETGLYLAASPEVLNVTGRYFEKKREQRSSESSHDEELARSLWRVSEELTGSSSQGYRSQQSR